MTQPSGDQSDLQELLSLASTGDETAWRLLVERYSHRVYGLVLKQSRDPDLAGEITQATFVQVVSHLASYQEQGRFESWLFRIASNRLRDEMRRRKRQATPTAMGPGSDDQPQAQYAADTPQPLETLTRDEQIQQLLAAMETLGESDREILYLRHTAGLSFAQIAQTLEQPLGTVLARGHRALGKLRKILGTPGSGE